MYDTVFLCLSQADVSGVDFLEVAPRFLVLVGVVGCTPRVRCDTGSTNGIRRAWCRSFSLSWRISQINTLYLQSLNDIRLISRR